MQASKTIDLKVGFKCNNDCRFCVVKDKRRFGDKKTAKIKTELEDGFKAGFLRVCFTGGEVTIREDIFEIVSFAKKIGYAEIMIQSNGRNFSSLSFTKKMVKVGANQFAVSVHGHNDDLHDCLTQRRGSFKELVQGIRNLKKVNQSVVTNTVISKLNYTFLPDIAQLLIGLGVSQYQLAFIHLNGGALENSDELVPWMSSTLPFLYKALDYGIQQGIFVETEAYPYCLMRGYEFYIAERYIPARTVVKEYGRSYEFDCIRKEQAKIKFSQCNSCDFNTQCEGTWREYPEKFGNEEFKPIISRFGKRLGTFALQSR